LRQAVVEAQGAAGERRLVAYAVPAQRRPSAGEVTEFLAATLPGYMVPSQVIFLDALPLTPNGKVDRRALPLPGELGLSGTAPYLPPQTAVERTIAEIFREVLSLETVGLRDNFFDLGGDSLLMMRAQARVCERLGQELSIVEMLRYATVEALSRHLNRARSQPCPTRDPETRAGRQKRARERQRVRMQQSRGVHE